MRSNLFRFTLVLITVLCVSGVSAGDLNPPGAPASTLIAGLPVATPITAVPVSIEESGVYYLTDSFSVASTSANGITVRADDVVIDMAGYSLIGPGAGTGTAVSSEDSVRVTVRNGTVRDFGAVGLFIGGQSTLEDLRIEDCPLGLVILGGGNVRRVSITGSDVAGIEAAGSELIDCSVVDCGAGIGVLLGSSVIRCSVQISQSVGISAVGPAIIRDCSVIGSVNAAFRGQASTVFEDCTALVAGTGFRGEGGVTIRSCTARICSAEGIAVAGSGGSSLIADCHVDSVPIGIRVNQAAMVTGNYVNNATTEGIQISATTEDVTVLDNVLMNTPSAIHNLGAGVNCFYGRNTYTGGVVLGVNATWGPLVISAGGDVEGYPGGDGPWANIQH